MGTKSNHFFTDKPLFGLDIGRGSLKVMQLSVAGKRPKIIGYGTADFDKRAIDNGVIIRPEIIAAALHDLFKKDLIGEITTRRVAMSLPGYRTFTRSIQLPKLGQDELRAAVELEVEQYIPVPLEELYLDYTVTSQTADNNEIFVVAVPKKIVDSYLAMAHSLGLEPILIEPTMTACARFFTHDKHSGITSIIIDFGSLSATISIFDKTILATSAVAAGGMVFTEAIRDKLGVSLEEAGAIKTNEGLGVSKYQKQVSEALEPSLSKVTTEVRRMFRYYEEHYEGAGKIEQIVTLGGGANMPGLSDYLTNALRVPIKTHEHPWTIFDTGGLKPPIEADRLMYAAAAGLGLLDSKKVFRP